MRRSACLLVCWLISLEPVAAQTPAPPQAPTKCSGAESPAMFRQCLAMINHAQPRGYRAAHPTEAVPKPPTQGPGFGAKPDRILPSLRPK